MKANTPSLILFFVTAIVAVLFRAFHNEEYELYSRSIVMPSLFIYYLVSNHYKISIINSIIFSVLFIRDLFNMLKVDETALGSFLCILFVYTLLLYSTIKDFRCFVFNKRDIGAVVLVFVGIGAICYSVLNLKFENLELNFFLYVIFGIVLSILSVITILNYYKNSSFAFFNALLMCICFIISDIFFVINKFYLHNEVFGLISLMTQLLSYFFMMKYLLKKEISNDEDHS